MLDDETLENAAAHLSQTFVAALRGRRELSWTLDGFPKRERLAEWLDDVSPSSAEEQLAAQGWLVYAQAECAERRIRRAVANDVVKVILADGSSLTLDEAEQTLMNKEEKGPYAPLASRIALATSTIEDECEPFFDTLEENGLHASHPGLLPGGDFEAAEKSLRLFIDDTNEAQVAALDVLQQLSKAGLEEPFALARALDMPNVKGAFSHDIVKALCGASLEKAGPRLMRPIKRMAVPRSMAGISLSGERTLRVGWLSSSRSARYSALLSGSAAGVGISLMGAPSLAADDAGRQVGAGFSFGWQRALLLKTLVDEEEGAALAKQQVLLSQKILLARMAASAAIVLLRDGRDFEALRESLAGLLHQDVGERIVEDLFLPPWPGQMRQRGLFAHLGSVAIGQGVGAAIDFALRERFDELWPIMDATYDWFDDVRGPLAHGSISLGALLELPGTPGAALSNALLELL
ncbi:MAG: hypothetical protein GY822_08665 [Deltaproteobacteria bacterium]|nr:hypothetical protein [Deltaproteobacteria bacterium]